MYILSKKIIIFNVMNTRFERALAVKKRQKSFGNLRSRAMQVAFWVIMQNLIMNITI